MMPTVVIKAQFLYIFWAQWCMVEPFSLPSHPVALGVPYRALIHLLAQEILEESEQVCAYMVININVSFRVLFQPLP
jgi:hypothetical protein